MEEFSREQIKAVETARDWGYFRSGMKGRPGLWKGRRVLDVGMGAGPHALAYISLGASEYHGVDPLVGTDSVRDFRSDKDPNIPSYHAFPYSTEEMKALFPQIYFYSGIMEDFAEELQGMDIEIALLDAVTEHLQNPEPVFNGIWKALKEGGIIHFSHCNYYSWTGHHENPRSVEELDLSNSSHAEVIDWKHLELDHPNFNEPNLNRVRLSDLKRLMENYFEIIHWKEYPLAIERLTPDIRKKYSQYSLSELLTGIVYATGVRRKKTLGYDFSKTQFHHPDVEYNNRFDFSDEDIGPYFMRRDLKHQLLFSSAGELTSHSDNNFGGDRILQILQKGDVITLEKEFKSLQLTFTELNLDASPGHPRARVKEDIPDSILKNNYNCWRIMSILRGKEEIYREESDPEWY